MKTVRRRWYRNMGLLLCVLGFGACARAPDNIPPSYFPSGPTEVDLEPMRPGGLIDRYDRPRIERLFKHDGTEVDLAKPLPSRQKDKTSPP